MSEQVPVKSSVIASVGYDPEARVMQVQLNSGSSYTYSGVSEDQYKQFLRAPSKGRHFALFVASRKRS